MAKRIVAQSSWIAPDFVPETFGRLTTVSSPYKRQGHRKAAQDCVCLCGNTVTAAVYSLRKSIRKSCGCLLSESVTNRNKNNATHNKSSTPEYRAWNAMLRRCYNTNNSNYPNWGGRGIGVWDTWRGPGGFELWFAEIGPRPSNKHSQERKDNNKNYEPGNICWATRAEQANNRRSGITILFDGLQLTPVEWGEKYAICARHIRRRILSGWSAEEAITTPLAKRSPRVKKQCPPS